MAKQSALSDDAAVTLSAPPPIATAEAAPEKKKPDNRKGQTLRLSTAAWRQLKLIAMDENTSVHQLLVDAVDDAFRKRGKPLIATEGQPDRRKP
jgi:hypothetical protein